MYKMLGRAVLFQTLELASFGAEAWVTHTPPSVTLPY